MGFIFRFYIRFCLGFHMYVCCVMHVMYVTVCALRYVRTILGGFCKFYVYFTRPFYGGSTGKNL